MTPELTEAAITLSAAVTTALLAWLTRIITTRLGVGTARDAALELHLAAETVVRHVEQTARAEATDGKLDQKEREELKRIATRMLREQLSNAARNIVTQHGEAALGRAIEAAVNRLKERT
ncbi:MAG: hypothetical protein KF718_33345 [Polyangiaceae bacterium]|nr:hypothetical protein [Polyangiaceae bacterium]